MSSRSPTPSHGWRRLRYQPGALVGLLLLAVVAVLTGLAPLLATASPLHIRYDALLQPPAPHHWLGTDDLGRDLLSRLMWGGRESLSVSIAGMALALLGGLGVGLLAGYGGGRVDGLLMRALDILLALPDILLLLVVVALLGPGSFSLVVALAVVTMPGYARLVRGLLHAARQLDFVLAARALGASDRRIILHHLLPTIVGPLTVYSTLGLGSTLMATTGLSFLGLGAQPPQPEWGAMLSQGIPFLREAWWVATFPGLAIFLTVLAFTLLGDGLRELLAPPAG